MAAHLEPDILLVDEVLSVGDADFQQKSLGKMNRIAKQGRTVIFVSHNMAAVRQLCTRCIRLSQGKLVKTGRPDEVVEDYLHRHRDSGQGFADLTGAVPRTGSQKARFTRIELRNQHNRVTGTYRIGDDLAIHLFISPKSHLRKVKIVLQILESTGSSVCNIYDSDSGFALRDVRAPVHVSLTIEDLRLCPGRYFISAELVSEIFQHRHDDYDLVESCISFDMINDRVMDRELKRYAGLLYLEPAWKRHSG